MTKTTTAMAAILAMAACAPNPDAIAPAALSGAAFTGLSCGQIAAEQARIAPELARAVAQQSEIAASDAAAVGIGLVLFWPALLAASGGQGDRAEDIAAMRGQIAALDSAAVARGC